MPVLQVLISGRDFMLWPCLGTWLRTRGKLVVLVRNPKHEVFAINIEVKFVALLGPPLYPVAGPTCSST